jgi:hypothetical protein
MPSPLLTNANRIYNELDELFVIVSDFKPEFIALSETWLNSDIPDSFCSLSSYCMVRIDRKGQLGG